MAAVRKNSVVGCISLRVKVKVKLPDRLLGFQEVEVHKNFQTNAT
jgi:hypothetical protein